MKEVKAIIKPIMLETVLDALREIKGLPAVTISQAHSLSEGHGAFDQIAKTRLEIILPDNLAETVVRAVQKAAHTGLVDDGCIVVTPIEQTMDVRTGASLEEGQ
ncbi:MAG: P-II family nitrogen regulator [Acidobacteria bacterium]|nr:P-II family nitrogen regulator [Acidobacteriota bacterium]